MAVLFRRATTIPSTSAAFTTITTAVLTYTMPEALAVYSPSSTKPWSTIIRLTTVTSSATLTYSEQFIPVATEISAVTTTSILTVLNLITSVPASSISSTASSTTSPTPSAIAKVSPGLASGAKAHIAVGVIAFVFLLIVVFVSLALRKRKRRQKRAGGRSQDPDTHEMATRHNVPEMDEQNKGRGLHTMIVPDIVSSSSNAGSDELYEALGSTIWEQEISSPNKGQWDPRLQALKELEE
ncbi:uncharacterized protein LY89DRAFT_732799 [Mollisia scopiformis]|uniref:Uncharacterized protein n=1 Tax=Mollisia scopiformis TaxID=149040 RepID=A0A194XEB9_MOLSC|nr:uncharacterized protein LY89DRAFT_732799 [Mollisia scopiformis]KUJ18107.1 hypothetical protein LY89DRAFT_732799 [Mollisia scopiformis]